MENMNPSRWLSDKRRRPYLEIMQNSHLASDLKFVSAKFYWYLLNRIVERSRAVLQRSNNQLSPSRV